MLGYRRVNNGTNRLEIRKITTDISLIKTDIYNLYYKVDNFTGLSDSSFILLQENIISNLGNTNFVREPSFTELRVSFYDLSGKHYLLDSSLNNINNYLYNIIDVSLSALQNVVSGLDSIYATDVSLSATINNINTRFANIDNSLNKLAAIDISLQDYDIILTRLIQDMRDICGGDFIRLESLVTNISGQLYSVINTINNLDISYVTNIKFIELANIVYNLDSSFVTDISFQTTIENNLSLTKSIDLLKNSEGIIINYYQPYNLFNSKRDSTNLYNNIDLYETDFFINTINFINEKNMIVNNTLNNKIYKNNSYTSLRTNIIDSYINNIYRGAFGSKINIYGNVDYIKAIDSIIYNNSSNDENDVNKYLQFINNNQPYNDISFNEIPKITHNAMTPPYYFELSGNRGTTIDQSCSIFFNNNASINDVSLNLLNFGGIEYEQNIVLLNHIYKKDVSNDEDVSNNNMIFYFYEQDNYQDFIKLFSHDLSNTVSNHIEKYHNFKDFVLDNSNIITYNYGNLLFLIDNSDCNISANPKNPTLKTSNNILSLLNINNIYISNYSDLSANFPNFNGFVENVNSSIGLNDIYMFSDFANIKLYNLTDLSSEKIIDYIKISENVTSNKNNSLILCPLPKNHYYIDDNNTFINDNIFINELYKYSSLLQTVNKHNINNSNNINFSNVISTNNSNLCNLISFDTSINYLYSEKNLYFTFYDLPNYTQATDGIDLFQNFSNLISDRSFQNGRNNNHTKIIYPFYYNTFNNLSFIDKYIDNQVTNNEFYNTYRKTYKNINNIKNIIYKGFIQAVFLYIIIYLFERFYKTANFSKSELLNFYNIIINNDLNSLSSVNAIAITDLSNSIYLINNLFNQSIYSDSNSFDYKLYKNNILLENIDSSLNTDLKDLINNNELLLALSSNNIKLNNINSNNHTSYYTLYNIANITSSSINENVYDLSVGDFSNNCLDNNLRYYLLNNWKQYFPNVENYL